MATSKDVPKALKDSTSATVNTLKRTSDTNEKANPRPAKQSKPALKPPKLDTAAPPSFLEDIVLPDEDDVWPFAIRF